MSRRTPRWQSSDVAWRGGKRPYDLVKEVTVSGAIVAILVIGLSVLFASPDPPAVSIQQWAKQSPGDFAATTLTELDGSSLSATYGPPYQRDQNGASQALGFFAPEKTLGKLSIPDPIQSFENYVVQPQLTIPGQPTAGALRAWQAASATQQAAWIDAYSKALAKVSSAGGVLVAVPAAGPVSPIMRAQYQLAVSGGLDNALRANPDHALYYANDQTLALMYLGDSGDGGGDSTCLSAGTKVTQAQVDAGCWFYNQAVSNLAPRHAGYLSGVPWGVINEVGNWPGAWWLFPYSFWYQVGPWSTLGPIDLFAMLATAGLTLVFMFVPWIPGLRSVPKLTRVYRLLWRDYYRMVTRQQRAGWGRPAPEPEPETVTTE